MNAFENFLQEEIYENGMYEDIIRFIISFHIRSGEFEGNRYVIKKMDRLNFVIFAEDTCPNGGREISHAISIFRNTLIATINNFAQAKGIKTISTDEESE